MTAKMICIGCCLLALSALAAAQEASSNTQSFEYTNAELGGVLSDVAKLYDVKVLSEPGIKGAVTAKATAASIDSALTMVTIPNKLAWREFVLLTKPTDKVTAQTLEDLMNALDTIQFSGLVMRGPQLETPMAIGRTAATETIIGSQTPEGSKYTHYYYVYDPTVTPEDPAVVKEKQPGRVFGMPDPQKDMADASAWFNSLDEATKEELVHQYEMAPRPGDIITEEIMTLPDGTSVPYQKRTRGKMIINGQEVPFDPTVTDDGNGTFRIIIDPPKD